MIASGGGTPLIPIPVDYIETDGSAYIDTGVTSTFPLSCDFEALFVGAGTMLGSRVANSGARSQLAITYNKRLDFGAGTAYYNGVDISASIDNATEVFVKAAIIRASQQSYVSAKQSGESSYTAKYASDFPAASGTSLPLFLFANNHGGVAANIQPSGTRLYYCKIYMDATLTTPVFDGSPCLYGDKYGLWDSVSDSFFGAVSGSGVFTFSSSPLLINASLLNITQV